MVWGARRGIDDLIERISRNDPALPSLCLLSGRTLNEESAFALCRALESNTVLKELDTGSHAVSPGMAAVFGEALAQPSCGLHSLSLGNRSFGDEGLAALCPGLARNSSLNHLNLEAKGITHDVCPALAVALARQSTIQQLTLSHNRLTHTGVLSLAGSLPGVKHLDVGMTELEGEAAGRALAQLLEGGRIEVLHCGGNQLGPGGAGALAPALPAATSLRQLHLAGCQLAAAGVASLAAHLPPNLAHLDLSDNSMGQEGAAALAGAFRGGAGCGATLRTLLLCDNGIGDSAAAQLAAALTQPSSPTQRPATAHLSLDLGGNEVGGAALRALGQLHHLRSLRLHNCQLGGAGTLELASLIRDPPPITDQDAPRAAVAESLPATPNTDQDAPPAAAADSLPATPARGPFHELHDLDLSANGIPPEALLALLRALMECPTACTALQLLVVAANEGLEGEELREAVQQLQALRPDLHLVRRAADSGELGRGEGS